jgi:hypothetical protein
MELSITTTTLTAVAASRRDVFWENSLRADLVTNDVAAIEAGSARTGFGYVVKRQTTVRAAFAAKWQLSTQ